MDVNIIKDFLSKVEKKVITITPDFNIHDAYSGNYCYKASNGWSIIVFIDCDEWDYIDSIEDESGNTIHDYNSGYLEDYRPNQKVIKEVYLLEQDKPYLSEYWIRYNFDNQSKHIIMNCDMCNNKMCFDFRYFNSTVDMMKVVDSFSHLHYYCNPIYNS